MKVSNGYFKHPTTGELVKPGEMYEEFDKRAIQPNTNHLYQAQALGRGNGETDNKIAIESADLLKCNLSELKKIAIEKAIEGSLKMNKEQLIIAIKETANEHEKVISDITLPDNSNLLENKETTEETVDTIEGEIAGNE